MAITNFHAGMLHLLVQLVVTNLAHRIQNDLNVKKSWKRYGQKKKMTLSPVSWSSYPTCVTSQLNIVKFGVSSLDAIQEEEKGVECGRRSPGAQKQKMTQEDEFGRRVLVILLLGVHHSHLMLSTWKRRKVGKAKKEAMAQE